MLPIAKSGSSSGVDRKIQLTPWGDGTILEPVNQDY